MHNEIYQGQVFTRDMGRHADADDPEPPTVPGPPPTTWSVLLLYILKVEHAEIDSDLCKRGPWHLSFVGFILNSLLESGLTYILF